MTTIGASNAPAAPPSSGYVAAGGGTVVATNPFGLCWRSGAEWSPEKAAEPCDAVPRASTPPAPVAAAPAPTPAPTPAPAPIAAAPIAAPPPVIEKVTLSTDLLFEFNKAELRPSGEQKLDELAKSAQGAAVDRVVVAGFADRIGTEEYNKDLSERRAQSVADYLASKGVDKNRLQVEGYGEEKPVTGNECSKMGPERKSNTKLVACLQPDRRVEVELLGSREVARGTTPAPAGAGATGTSGSSPSGSTGSSPSGSTGSSPSGSTGSSSSGGGSGLK